MRRKGERLKKLEIRISLERRHIDESTIDELLKLTENYNELNKRINSASNVFEFEKLYDARSDVLMRITEILEKILHYYEPEIIIKIY